MNFRLYCQFLYGDNDTPGAMFEKDFEADSLEEALEVAQDDCEVIAGALSKDTGTSVGWKVYKENPPH